MRIPLTSRHYLRIAGNALLETLCKLLATTSEPLVTLLAIAFTLLVALSVLFATLAVCE
jgi:hypothetical protein